MATIKRRSAGQLEFFPKGLALITEALDEAICLEIEKIIGPDKLRRLSPNSIRRLYQKFQDEFPNLELAAMGNELSIKPRVNEILVNDSERGEITVELSFPLKNVVNSQRQKFLRRLAEKLKIADATVSLDGLTLKIILSGDQRPTQIFFDFLGNNGRERYFVTKKEALTLKNSLVFY